MERVNYKPSMGKSGKLAASATAVTAALALSLLFAGTVSAHHNGADVTYDTVECGETTFSAGVVDPQGTHNNVTNMYLVVNDGGDTQSENIPTDGSTVDITVGPFTNDTTIQWRVWGGAERDYDRPLWNGHGDTDFKDNINAYGAVNGWGWVIAGPNDPNPFTTWNELKAEGGPEETEDEGQVLNQTTEDEQVVAPVGAVDAGDGNTGASIGAVVGLIASVIAAGAGLAARLYNKAV